MAGNTLYDDVIMDHIKNARNYRVLERSDRVIVGSNPLCGDEVTLYLGVVVDDVIDVSFQCDACGIAMASGSIMTELLNGIRVADAQRISHDFVEELFGRTVQQLGDRPHGERALMETVRRFPARVQCAALPWAILDSALGGPAQSFILR